MKLIWLASLNSNNGQRSQLDACLVERDVTNGFQYQNISRSIEHVSLCQLLVVIRVFVW